MSPLKKPFHYKRIGDHRTPLVINEDFTGAAHLPDDVDKRVRYKQDLDRGLISEKTGLPNEKGFKTLLVRYMDEHDFTKFQGWVIFLDVNGLKEINDTSDLKHEGGDALIKSVGARLLGIDGLFSHKQGDEFIGFIPKFRSHETVDANGIIHEDRRSERATDVKRVEDRINSIFAEQYVRYTASDGEPKAEFEISVAVGAVEVDVLTFEELAEAINIADARMSDNKLKSKLEKIAKENQEVIDQASGKNAFMKLIEDQVNTPESNEIRDLAVAIGFIKDGKVDESVIVSPLDRKVTKLLDLLYGTDAERYLDFLVTGRYSFNENDVVPKGFKNHQVGR